MKNTKKSKYYKSKKINQNKNNDYTKKEETIQKKK